MGLRLLLIEESYQTWSTTAPVTKWLVIFPNLWIRSLTSCYFWACWGRTRQLTAATAGYYPENSFLICVKARRLRCAQGAPLCSLCACRSAHKPRSVSGVHPMHKCGVQGFWETSRMQHQHKKRTSCSAVTPVLDDTPEDMERRLSLSSHSRLGARTPPSDTKAALSLSAGLFPRLFCLFVSRHRAHSLDATRFHSISSELDPAIWKKPLLVEIMMLPSKEGLKVWYWTNF